MAPPNTLAGGARPHFEGHDLSLEQAFWIAGVIAAGVSLVTLFRRAVRDTSARVRRVARVRQRADLIVNITVENWVIAGDTPPEELAGALGLESAAELDGALQEALRRALDDRRLPD